MTSTAIAVPMRAGVERYAAPDLVSTPPDPVTITQLPAVVNLVIYQGDDFYLDLTVTDANGDPADLTGFAATSQVRPPPTGDGTPTAAVPPMATFTCTIDGNIIHLHLPATEAANLANKGIWDCQIKATDVITLVYGKVAVTLQATPG